MRDFLPFVFDRVSRKILEYLLRGVENLHNPKIVRRRLSFIDYQCIPLLHPTKRERERWWRDNWIALNIHVRIDAKWDKLQHRHSFPCELISNYSSYLSSFPWNQPLYLSDERAQDHAHAKDVQWQIDSRYSRLHLHQKWRPVEYSNDREYWLIHCQVHLMMDISFRWKNKQC